MSVSGMALQLILMKGPYLRLLRKCIELATSSLPVPVSPIMRTEVFEVLATVSMRLLTSFKALDEPTISGQSLLPSSAGFTEGLPHRAHGRRRGGLPFYEVVLRAFPHGPGSEVLVGKAREEHYGDIGAGLVHCSEC